MLKLLLCCLVYIYYFILIYGAVTLVYSLILLYMSYINEDFICL